MTEYSKIRYTPSQAKSKIAKYCAYQERCHQEVRDKLYSFGLSPDDVELLIFEMIQHNFLNEERFVVAFVRGKFIYKKWGRVKIKMELKRRKISDYCINKGMKEIDGDKYEEVLHDLLKKKVNSLKTIKGYQKKYVAAQFAMNKGFERDAVWTVINERFSEK